MRSPVFGEQNMRRSKIPQSPPPSSIGEKNIGGRDPAESDDLVDTILDLLWANDNDKILRDTEISIDSIIDRAIGETDENDVVVSNNTEHYEGLTKDLEKQNNNEINLNSFLENIIFQKKSSESTPRKTKSFFGGDRKYFVVAIDAGHGGIDSGALGAMGTREKDINLEFAKILGKELRKNKNIKVYLLRQNDKYLSIAERIKKARALNANLFISVHSDASPSKMARGLSVYRLSESGLRTRRKKMADNIVSRMGLKITEHSALAIVMDMLSRDNFYESTRFADVLAQNFRKNNVNMLFPKPRGANFGVLLASEFPSVLIELGFVSNLGDEILLKSKEYRENLARYIAKSVEDCFMKKPAQHP
ncbi:MAG: N-acetylmuramoyl-L-alanine amidase [Rickettsiales bacterium]|jgi:N-acetylmuramoyl-L-alanine amidase|nr:N-acetylmuramoyl-L-alanine amidase [Rickettsiales bacterium]